MEELFAQQRMLRHSLERAKDNFRKVGKANLTIAIVSNRLKSLRDDYDKNRILHARILANASPEMIATHKYFLEDHNSLCEDAFLTASDYMTEWQLKLEPPPPAGSETTSVNPNVTTFVNPRSSTQLPRLNLPKFAGAFLEWESFRDRFKSFIISNESLQDVTRLQYLHSCLHGDAFDLIRNIPFSDSNFKIAWELLSARYDNSRRLVHEHIQALHVLAPVTVESATALNTLRDKFQVALKSLRNLGRPVDHWDDLLVYLLVQKIDKATRKAWELKLGDSHDYPTYKQLDQFLSSRVSALDNFSLISSPAKGSLNSKASVSSHNTTTTQTSCSLCRKNHYLSACPDFRNKSSQDRRLTVNKLRCCFNCLGAKHSRDKCRSKYSCRVCQKRHHSLLHCEPENETATAQAQPEEKGVQEATVSSHVVTPAQFSKSNILLATALVQISSQADRKVVARALIDQGSITTVISSKLAKQLKLSRQRVAINISGVGDTTSSARYSTQIRVAPRTGKGPDLPVIALILDSLTKYTPSCSRDLRHLPHLQDLEFADPDPASNDPIEVIIGADLYGIILREGLRRRSSHDPIAQNTLFGWILSGATSSQLDVSSTPMSSHHCTLSTDLNDHIKRFWEVEEIPQKAQLTPDDVKCEAQFKKTHTRTSEGRYMVRLPFKVDPPLNLGESKPTASVLYQRSEARLTNHPQLAREYDKFLREYLSLRHMTKVKSSCQSSSQIHYIPHHAVIREDSTTTRLRVVFNASARTSNGKSLNDYLLIGPKLQTDLPSVITLWRKWQFAYTADISKMYRQILMDPRDVDYQRILWRSEPHSQIEEYRLLTVTYGTASAPYLALRVLQQLADDEGEAYPLATTIIRKHMYVDDCVFGAEDIQQAIKTRDQLIELLKSAGFTLHKWAFNNPDLAIGLNIQDNSPDDGKVIQGDDSLKVLGLQWSPSTDTFHIKVTIPVLSTITKRTILSAIARLYDPLGWITPVIISAKIMMQKLWQARCDWDTPLPEPFPTEWQNYAKALPTLEKIALNRWTGQGPHSHSIELHGFSDASTAAYGAALYMKCCSFDGTVRVTLLCAKSRVSPLKTISIPRLELCGALLLAQLVSFAVPLIHTNLNAIFCWTDSTVALAWISQPPTKWKSFVANRVQEIQTLVPNASWRYVPSRDNPADLASRGIPPSLLHDKIIWWEGPAWLKMSTTQWPTTSAPTSTDYLSEERKGMAINVAHTTPEWELSERFSSWVKLLRVTSYVQRFLQQVRRRLTATPNLQPEEIRRLSLSPIEISSAEMFWLKYIQGQLFKRERDALYLNHRIPKTSKLISLNPYLDEFGIMRVGGRLRHSLLSNDAKHPVVLASHPLVTLIIRDTHLKALHATPQLTLSLLRQKFWILRARQTIRAVLYKCIPCTRESARADCELMGDLPDVRVRPVPRAFTHCGIDYAGPTLIRSHPGRGYKSHKAYIAVFICMTVKAVHLELVSDCSTAAFRAAFNRFCARRGVPSTVYSDNATNFHGAKKEIESEWRAFTRVSTVFSDLADKGVHWKFIPPATPHFGGLWEACVRSVKYHLKRVIGDHTLTIEEMMTVLCNIEACLNSRPLGAMSDNLDDYTFLTPGHFLVGTSLLATPEASLLEERETRLSRWQLTNQMRDSFWRSWSTDYMQTLQQRLKWREINRHAKVGRLVLLRNTLTPPTKWQLGRIIECHPGEDTLIRVVTVKTAQASYKRSITKLCFLPIDINTVNDSAPE